MYAQIKTLQYWKTEHGDLNGCQDAFNLDPARGIFVVADGAGTTLFPGIWARILANQFVKIPLMSKDPFEVEWWVRQAQEEYKREAPGMAQLMDWSIRQKAQNQSSDSTLATLRISQLDASSAQADLLVFGDSCIITGNTQTKEVESFVLQHAEEFAQPPICIPSALKFFNRDFHTCKVKRIALGPEHVVILASDAVAKWIVGGGGGRFTGENAPWEAFQTVRELTEETWPSFIDECRANKEMVNDDSTALILELKEDGAANTKDYEPLGSSTAHDVSVIQKRKTAFEEARQEKNNELVAIYYGDGEDLKDLHVPTEEIKWAQKVADALKEVLRAFRHAQNLPGLAAKMQPVWRQYGPILQNEKCAENIRETLQRNGVNLSLSDPQSQQSPQIGASSVPAGKQAVGVQPLAGQSTPVPDKEALEYRFFKSFSSYIGSGDKKENYEQLLQAVDELEAARIRYPDIHRYNPSEEEEIAQARKYQRAMQNLQRAFNEGLIEKIDAAYDLSLINEKRLTPDEKARTTKARLWMTACRTENDKMILSNMHDLHKFFILTQQDLERIDLAQRREAVLSRFQAVLKTGSLREIVNVYDPVLESSKELTESDRELLKLAQEFVKAMQEDDDYALVAAYEEIKRSAFRKQIALTEEERERIGLAEKRIKTIAFATKEIVAKGKGVEITLEQVRKLYVINRSVRHYWIEQARREVDKAVDEGVRQGKKEQAAKQEAYYASKKLVNDILEELVDDRLIQAKMTEDNLHQAFQNEITANQTHFSHLEFMRTSLVADYQSFLKSNWLNEQDIEEFLVIKARFDFFKAHYEEAQQKSMLMKKTLRGWLDKQKRELVYLPDLNPEQRVAWLANQVGWRESRE